MKFMERMQDSVYHRTLFSLPVQIYRKSDCITPSIGGGGGGVDKMLKFDVKVFKVMSKALSGELSCTRTGLVNIIVDGVFVPFKVDIISVENALSYMAL